MAVQLEIAFSRRSYQHIKTEKNRDKLVAHHISTVTVLLYHGDASEKRRLVLHLLSTDSESDCLRRCSGGRPSQQHSDSNFHNALLNGDLNEEVHVIRDGIRALQ